jgi:dihydrodipicolinate synthase/N-acetylneuraminate lyase
MNVYVREAKPREKVKEIHGYDELFRKIFAQGLTGFVSVLDVN